MDRWKADGSGNGSNGFWESDPSFFDLLFFNDCLCPFFRPCFPQRSGNNESLFTKSLAPKALGKLSRIFYRYFFIGPDYWSGGRGKDRRSGGNAFRRHDAFICQPFYGRTDQRLPTGELRHTPSGIVKLFSLIPVKKYQIFLE